MKKIKRNYKKITEEIKKLGAEFVFDLFVDLYEEQTLQHDFDKFFSCKVDMKIIPLITNVILNRENKYKEFLNIIMLRNFSYLKTTKYLEYDIKELKKIFRQEHIPSIHGTGLSSEMIILYYFSKNIFQGKFLGELKNEFSINQEKILQEKDKYTPKKTIFGEDFFASKLEREFALFSSGDIKNFEAEPIEKLYECSYNHETETFFNVRKGLLAFLYVKMKDYEETMKQLNGLYGALSSHVVMFNRSFIALKNDIENVFKIQTENHNLIRKATNLKKENEELQKKETAIVPNKKLLQKENENLQKENYYLKTRIENLEQELSELQKEKEINKEITENVLIEDHNIINIESNYPSLKKIIVSGGKWNSKTKEETSALLQEHLNDVEFIAAEETVRKYDKIKNADIIIFDTSLHAHKYYKMIKDITEEFYHISKSNMESIKNIFEKPGEKTL